MSESDPKPSLHIDTDWKKQAQEEKRRLAEAEKAKAAQPAPSSSPAVGAPTGGTTDSGATRAATATSPAGASARGGTPAREMPPPSFATLVQSIVTQALFYLGDLAPRGSEPMLNLDMAKHQIDLLGVVEEKTANNLDADEKRLLDAALYETRMRYISVASQFLGP
jgi:hypothetical protein